MSVTVVDVLTAETICQRRQFITVAKKLRKSYQRTHVYLRSPLSIVFLNLSQHLLSLCVVRTEVDLDFQVLASRSCFWQ